MLVTGCQSVENTHAVPVATDQTLPDFSPDRAASEAATFESYKSKPDFTKIDVVAIVPTTDE